ncbi:6-phosphogluconolactonase, eukaryotic type [hydrothermal vent metagenome]|uniref:6-phosphogluconolactonase, eukaryotic type n=1 Tax=hydrothermal vent metagenome TaxID=652676 RepID=A0A3B0Y2M6_9ZZZZ
MHNWHVYRTFEEASEAAADFLSTQIEKSVNKKNISHVVLPGGNSPQKCLNKVLKKSLPWDKIHWYPGDERCYPQGHNDRNDVMLQNNFWSHINNPHAYRVPAELGAEKAAAMYREIISAIDQFDIVFLGMGEDGHTASLFPDNMALQDMRSVVPVYDSPKPPSERVSLSVNTLKRANCRMVLTGGKGKSGAIKKIRENVLLPVNCIGDINWFVDEAAVRAF